MDKLEVRILRCFQGVFPGLSLEEIPLSTYENTAAWDSVASVTLFAAIEEEFEIEIPVSDLVNLLSFGAVSDYLRNVSVSDSKV